MDRSKADLKYLNMMSDRFFQKFEDMLRHPDDDCLIALGLEDEELLYMCVDDMLTADMIVNKEKYFK